MVCLFLFRDEENEWKGPNKLELTEQYRFVLLSSHDFAAVAFPGEMGREFGWVTLS